MSDLEQTRKNLNLYIKYLDNLKKDKEYRPSKEEQEAIAEINSKVIKKDAEIKRLLTFLNVAPNLDTMQKLVNQYVIDEEAKKVSDQKDLISKVYGIDIEDIEHKYLQNGKEIFAFYDSKLNRKRVMENVNEQTLTEQLKKMQNDNENYQTENYSENSEQTLKDQAYENKSELQMIYIPDVEDYKVQINALDNEKLNSFRELLAKADALQLTYINIEEQIALDKDGKIWESTYNKKEGKSIVETPQSYRYNEDEMSNEDTTYNNIDSIKEENGKESEEVKEEVIEEINEEYFNEYEDMAELIDAEYKTYYVNVKVDKKAIFEKIKEYYKNPELMDKLVGNEKEFYEKMVDIYGEKIDQKKKENKPLTKKNTNPDLNNYGFGYVLLLTIIVIIAFIVTLFFIINA